MQRIPPGLGSAQTEHFTMLMESTDGKGSLLQTGGQVPLKAHIWLNKYTMGDHKNGVVLSGMTVPDNLGL